MRCRVTHRGVVIELGDASRTRAKARAIGRRVCADAGRTFAGVRALRARRGVPSQGRRHDDFRMDWDRIARTGTAEAVLCDGKSAAQIDAIVAHAQSLDRRLLLTQARTRAVRSRLPLRDTLDYDDVSRTGDLGPLPAPRQPARVAIVSGGTSDLPVALRSRAHARVRRAKRARASSTSASPACGA